VCAGGGTAFNRLLVCHRAGFEPELVHFNVHGAEFWETEAADVVGDGAGVAEGPAVASAPFLVRLFVGDTPIEELAKLLQRPGAALFWSRSASQAIGQCAEYIEHLAVDAEQGLRGRPEIVAFHPRAIVVIGRSHDWTEEQYRALARLNNHLVGITVMTYDQLLAQGIELIRLFGADEETAELQAKPAARRATPSQTE
jgi:Domain of unknown function (DUF4263)